MRDLTMQDLTRLTLADQIAGWNMQDLTDADHCAATSALSGPCFCVVRHCQVSHFQLP